MNVKNLNLLSRIKNLNEVVRIDNYFILASVDNRENRSFPDLSYLKHPHRLETTAITWILEGEMTFTLDLNDYRIAAPCLVINLPGQILQRAKRSDNYIVKHMHFSKEFIDNLSNCFKDYSLFYYQVQNQPVIDLSEEDVNQFIAFFDKARETVLDTNKAYRIEIITQLSSLLFYEILSRIKREPEDLSKSNRTTLVNKFLNLVRENHMEHRELSFYAGKLGLTAKYLTTVIKRESGVSASDWIEKYVILQAQALLKSTDLTIQQISDKLNFSSQVFFGKYFKRLVGMPPKEYRKQI